MIPSNINDYINIYIESLCLKNHIIELKLKLTYINNFLYLKKLNEDRLKNIGALSGKSNLTSALKRKYISNSDEEILIKTFNIVNVKLKVLSICFN